MKTMVKAVIMILMGMFIMNTHAQGDWISPTSADAIMNPLKNDQQTIKQGKKLYSQYCVICHGNKGKGDGIASVALVPRPMDFTSSKFKEQSDGAIYWKLIEGRTPMASYKEVLSESQRWQLINYIKSFKK